MLVSRVLYECILQRFVLSSASSVNVCQTQRKDWIEKDGLLEIHLQSMPLSFEIINEKN
jgi:hypothetical protein